MNTTTSRCLRATFSRLAYAESTGPFISTGDSSDALMSSSLAASLTLWRTFMNIEQRAGFMTIATNRLELRVTMRVSGRYPMNSPMMPGQKSIGENAASVVIVEQITG